MKLMKVLQASQVVSSGHRHSRCRSATSQVLMAFVLLWASVTAQAQTLTNNQDANIVVGQPDFTSQNIAVNQTTFPGPVDVAISATGKMAVADQSANRVLIYNSIPTSNGAAADVVVGKPDFTSFASATTQSGTASCDGVAFSPDGSKLLITDNGNHRVLIWNTVPTTNGQPADIVIGQSDFTSNSSGTSATKYNNPQDLIVTASGKLLVSDRSNHRVLIYNSIPTSNGAAADVVVGQADFSSNGSGNGAAALNEPWGLEVTSSGKLLVGDELNHRVLVYNSIPTTNGAAADVVIGQPAFGQSTPGTAASIFRNPVGVSVSAAGKLSVSEFGNNRVLIFNTVPTTNGAAADVVLGQPDFTSNTSFNGGISAHSMSRPYIALFSNDRLFVAGRDMHRVMIYDAPIPPALDLDGTTTGSDSTQTFTENTPVAVAPNLTLTSSRPVNSATITLTNRPDGALEFLASAGAPGLTVAPYDAATGVLSISGTASAATYQQVLAGVTYQNTSDNPDTIARLITFTVNDAIGSSNTPTATLSVVRANDAPVNSVPGAQSILEDNALVFQTTSSNALSVSDVDSDSLTVTLSVTNGTLTLSGTTGLAFTTGSGTADTAMTFSGTPAAINAALNGLIFTPTPNANGDAVLTLISNDGTQSDTDSVTVTIVEVNDVPGFTIGANQTTPAEAGAQSVANFATNISAGPANESGQALAFTVTNNNNTLFTAQPAIAPNGTLTFTPAINASGTATVSVVLRDNGGTSNGGVDNSAVQTFTITIVVTNRPPVAQNQSVTTNENTSKTIVLTATDPNGDALTFSIVASPQNGRLSGKLPNVIYTPRAGFTGRDRFTFKVNDGKIDSNVATIALQVLAVNDAPLVQSQQLHININKATPITLRAKDPEGDAFTYFVGKDLPGSTNPADKGILPRYGTLTGTAPNLIYTPRENYVGRDVFTFYASDGKAVSKQARIEIQVGEPRVVAAINDSYNLMLALPERAQNAGVTLLSDGTFRIAAPGVLANDRSLSQAPLSARLARGPQHGRIQINADGSFDYQPSTGFAGTDEFTYTLSNGQNSDTARVRLIVLDRRGPELRFDSPTEGATGKTVSSIRGRVRDRESGVKSMSLLWRRFDGAFWNGSQWTASATDLPITVDGTFWKYEGELPTSGTDRTSDLLEGSYAMQATAVDNIGNVSRLIINFNIDNSAPELPDFSSVRLSSGVASVASDAIVLRFTGALDEVAAIDGDHYALMVNGVAVGIGNADYSENTVTLSNIGLEAGDELTLQISDLLDAEGKTLRAGTINLVAR